MQFERQRIPIVMSNNQTGEYTMREVEGTVGVGSGLVYHPSLGGENGGNDGYTLTHLNSGSALSGDWVAETEEEAQRWLERVAVILDWTAEIAGIMDQLREKHMSGPSLKQQIEQALTHPEEEGHP